MSSTKQEILARIRSATGGPTEDRTVQYEAIPRQYRRNGDESEKPTLETFIDRLTDYGSNVAVCREDEIRQTVGWVLAERSLKGLLIPAGLSAEWLPEGYHFVRDEGLTCTDLDGSAGVLTGCAAAIALTGTIVLRHSQEEGRRALTLVPDYHLCLVFESQVFATVPEAVAAMASFGSAPMTTISGSSATADIEMTRVKGVHGPRTLDVIVVEEAGLGVVADDARDASL